jgi:hypothetical protein
MPPQLYKRLDKWTHEPQSNFNHKKHIFNASRVLLFSSLIKSENSKTYLLSSTTKTQKQLYFIALVT